MSKLVALIACCAMVLTACGGGEEAQTTTSPLADVTTTATSPTRSTTSSSSSLTAVEPDRWPWSGRPVDAGTDPSLAEILVAKYSNAPKARPQQGLEAADLVMEVLVEGGVARFLAVFQSSVPDVIGPLRSAREVDPKLIEPFNAFFASSGGQPSVLREVASVAVNVSHGPGPGYFRMSGRPAPYDLFLETAELFEVAEQTPGDNVYFEFDDQAVPGEQALSVEVSLSNFQTTKYRYSAVDSGYLRFNGEEPHITLDEDQLVASTVVVLFVEQLSTGRFDASGSPVPDYEVTGAGDAVVFRDGVAIRGTWERGRSADFFRVFDEDGDRVPFSAGQIWYELVPVGRTVSWQ